MKHARSHRLLAIGALALGIVMWELGGWNLSLSFFPPLSSVVSRLYEMITAGLITPHLTFSLSNLAVAYTMSVVGGTAIGVLMGISWRVEAALDIYVYTLLSVPTLVFAPIFFTIWGLGGEVIIAVIVLNTILDVIVNTSTAIKTAPLPLREMAQSFGAGRVKVFRRVLLPAAMPLVIASYVIAAPRAVKGMVNGEMFIAATGLGAIVMNAGSRFDATTVLAVVLMIVFLSFILVGILGVVRQKVTGWLPSTARGE